MDYGAPESLRRHTSWDAFCEEPQQGRLVLLTTKAATPLQEFEFRQDDCLIFGRESAGAPEEVHAKADARIIIPINADARSFNLATSASIALFEALRQTGNLPG
jgi:tRNA (cytidine/uridine-2'-O-)-methyltransferase